jgi:bacterioferritin
MRDVRRQKVAAALNKARSMELYAITQYMSQHYALDDMDYGALAANMKLIAIDEMRHAEAFAERIKDLKGDPVTERDGSAVLRKGQEVRDIYLFNSGVELDTMEVYNQLIQICRENGDSISARLLEDIALEEQIHQSYFDDVAEHIDRLGEKYLSNLAGTSSSTGGATRRFAGRAAAAE